MHWEIIGAIAQLMAAIAVIPSIIYLAVETRNHNKESRRAAASVFLLHLSDFRKSISDNGDFAAILLRGLESFDALDPVEKLRFGSGLGRLFNLSEGLYLFYLDQALSPELWKTIEQTTADLAAYPGVQAWWATRKRWHTAKFRAVVDRMIAEGNKPEAYTSYLEAEVR